MDLQRLYGPNRLATSIPPGVAALVAWLAGLVGPLDELGFKTTLARVGAGLGAAAIVYLSQLLARRLQLESQLAGRKEPLGLTAREVLGDPQSELAEPASADGTIPYVARNADDEVRRVLEEKRVAVLVGPSGSGKSATARAVARSFDENAIALVPRKPTRRGDTTVSDVVALTPRRPSSAWLWLDDLGTYLQSDPVQASSLRKWLSRSNGRRIVVTLSAKDRDALMRESTPAAACVRELLDMTQAHHLGVSWHGAEHMGARASYPNAGDGCNYLSRYLSSGRVHLRRYRDAEEASPVAAAILSAATAWRRASLGNPVPRSFLRSAFSLYMPGRWQPTNPDEVFNEGIAWATDPLEGHDAVLEPADAETQGYVIAEVAVEEAVRRSQPIPDRCWRLLLDEVRGTPSEVDVADAARANGRDALFSEALLPLLLPRAAPPAVQDSASIVYNERFASLQHSPGSQLPLGGATGVAARSPTIPARPPIRGRSRVFAFLYRHAVLWATIRTLALAVGDILAIWLAVIAAYFLTSLNVDFGTAQRATDQRIAFISLLVVSLFAAVGLYRSRSRRGGPSRPIAALVQGAVGLIILRLLVGSVMGSYALLIWSFFFACCTITATRAALTAIGVSAANRGRGERRRCALVGNPAQVQPVASVMRTDDRERVVVGYIGAAEAQDEARLVEHLGRVGPRWA